MGYWMHWHNVRYEAGRQGDRLLMKIAWTLPRRLVMWCYVRVGAHATTGEYSKTVVPELSMLDALGRWGA
jgi:hypothetical protein